MHSLMAEFEATPEYFTLKRGLLTSGNSQFSLTARMDDYVHPKVIASYASSLDTRELSQLLKEPTLIGVVKLAGSAEFESDPKKPVLETLSLEGNLNSSGIQVHTATVHTLVRDISARYRLEKGGAEVRDFKAAVLGGRINGNVRMDDLSGAQAAELNAKLENVPLAGIQALVNAQAMKDFRLTGTTNATVAGK